MTRPALGRGGAGRLTGVFSLFMAHNTVVMVKIHGCRLVCALKFENHCLVFLNVTSGAITFNRFIVTGMQKCHRRHFIPF
jgi:hypothetical protein